MKIPLRLAFILCLSPQVVAIAPAQENEPFHLSADSLGRHGRIWLDKNWKYHAGDQSEWREPGFDDRHWEIADTRLEANHLPKSGWPGVGWFRMHLAVDSTLWQQPLILTMSQAGAAEIYLNGRAIYEFGEDGLNPQKEKSSPYHDFASFAFEKKIDHVIAIRYANYSAETFHGAGYEAGFYLFLGYADVAIERATNKLRADSSFQMFFTALALAFGILHLILFLFSPRAKSNLYFAIFVFLYAANIFFDYQNFLATDLRSSLFYLRIHRAVMSCSPAFALLFIYSLFEPRIPKQFWIIALGLIVTGLFAVRKPIANLNYIQIFVGAVAVEMIRVVRAAIRNKKDGVWIIAAGFMLLFFFSAYDLLLDLHLMRPFHGINNGYPLGFLGLIISMSIYLARDFAKTNEKLLRQERQAKEQEIQRRLLEADNARKTKELEEARQLQLSMLPQTVPQLPHLDIAVYMKTATEVGGDYYDFHLSEDGALTVAIGDATGHGAKAGTMVATTKGLFGVLAKEADIRNIFATFTRTIKTMNLGSLYMAMTLVKIKEHRLVASSAGMPPPLIYRAATRQVEELELKGMPLGLFAEFPYKVEEVKLNIGDTILLMSDGLPEMFNYNGEILDYPEAKNLFAEVADKPPQEIIVHLNKAGAAWANGRPQEDDVTFVVMKVTQSARLAKTGKVLPGF